MLMTAQKVSGRRQFPTQLGSALYLPKSDNYAPSTKAKSNTAELGSKCQMNAYPINYTIRTLNPKYTKGPTPPKCNITMNQQMSNCLPTTTHITRPHTTYTSIGLHMWVP